VGVECDDAGMGQHLFRGEVWEHSAEEPGSWHLVRLPAEVAEDIALEAGPREGFGSIRVEARIGSTTWRTSLFPEAATATFVLPVKRSVRQAEGLHAGAICDVAVDVMRA
jgi:hypothetical protein